MQINTSTQRPVAKWFIFDKFVERSQIMITDAQRRNQIPRHISQIPKDRLKELDEYNQSGAR